MIWRHPFFIRLILVIDIVSSFSFPLIFIVVFFFLYVFVLSFWERIMRWRNIKGKIWKGKEGEEEINLTDCKKE